MMTCSVSWAEWNLLVDDEKISYWIDRNSIRKAGAISKVWTMTSHSALKVNKSGYRYKSTKSLYAYDCNNEVMALLSLVFHANSMGTGEVLQSWTYTSNEIEWDHIVPNTVSELEWKIACGKK